MQLPCLFLIQDQEAEAVLVCMVLLPESGKPYLPQPVEWATFGFQPKLAPFFRNPHTAVTENIWQSPQVPLPDWYTCRDLELPPSIPDNAGLREVQVGAGVPRAECNPPPPQLSPPFVCALF